MVLHKPYCSQLSSLLSLSCHILTAAQGLFAAVMGTAMLSGGKKNQGMQGGPRSWALCLRCPPALAASSPHPSLQEHCWRQELCPQIPCTPVCHGPLHIFLLQGARFSGKGLGTRFNLRPPFPSRALGGTHAETAASAGPSHSFNPGCRDRHLFWHTFAFISAFPWCFSILSPELSSGASQVSL